jgi:excisionase family DNA binding protein
VHRNLEPNEPIVATETAIRAAVDALVATIMAAVREQATPESSQPDRLHSITSAAATMGVGRSFLYSEIAAGRLASLKAGRRRLVSASAIAAYIAGRAR